MSYFGKALLWQTALAPIAPLGVIVAIWLLGARGLAEACRDFSTPTANVVAANLAGGGQGRRRRLLGNGLVLDRVLVGLVRGFDLVVQGLQRASGASSASGGIERFAAITIRGVTFTVVVSLVLLLILDAFAWAWCWICCAPIAPLGVTVAIWLLGTRGLAEACRDFSTPTANVVAANLALLHDVGELCGGGVLVVLVHLCEALERCPVHAGDGDGDSSDDRDDREATAPSGHMCRACLLGLCECHDVQPLDE
jgi:hypothetical protein